MNHESTLTIEQKSLESNPQCCRFSHYRCARNFQCDGCPVVTQEALNFQAGMRDYWQQRNNQ